LRDSAEHRSGSARLGFVFIGQGNWKSLARTVGDSVIASKRGKLKMRALALAFAFVIAASHCNAACIGSSTFSNCSDDSGNNYTVQRFGNQTMMNGSNAQTGSNWSQHSTTLGNSTYTNGTTNGRSWNETQTNFGGVRSIYGTDSDGRSYNYTCTQYGGCN
jgi:hypothetical protein